MQLFPRIHSGMANSVDPDQTPPSGAVLSGSALTAYAILSESLVFEILGHLLYLLFLKGEKSIFQLMCNMQIQVLHGTAEDQEP